jgi:sugar lactone lactonase YvrE
VFGGKAGYGIFDKKTGKYETIKKFWTEEEIKDGKERRMRSNDGAVDAKGRYWVTTMNDPEEDGVEVTDEGVIFRLDHDGTLHRMIEKVSIPNGISWSKDNKLMYFTDSPTKNIFVADFDLESGNFSNKRVFFTVDEEGAVPDGHCQDEEGYFWVALYGGGKVVRVSPEGNKVAEVLLPTRCTTCPGIAGEDLFVTTADDEEAPKDHPTSAKFGGALFKHHIGVKGCKLNRFKWSGGS